MALAIFDLDDTLINGDSASLWLQFMVREGLAPASMLPREAELMQQYHAGQLSMEEYMAFTLQPLQGRKVTEVADWVSRFIVHDIRKIIFPAARQQIAHYGDNGWRRLIISATGEHLVGPIARLLGIDEFLAIHLQSVDGIYTGQTEGILTFREGKLLRLNEWLADQDETLHNSHGYSDSINDLPLLQTVEHAFVVNPSSELANRAAANGWQKLLWQCA